MTTAEAIKELMQKWDITRAAWIKTFGTEAGFSQWFTAQVFKDQKDSPATLLTTP